MGAKKKFRRKEVTKFTPPKKLDLKYASLWYDLNYSKIPAILKPPNYYKPLNKRDEEMYSTGAWAVLNEMAEDGLIKQETIRKIHNKENGWIDRSSITVGRVPDWLWLEIGIVLGLLVGGGIQLVAWVIGLII